MRYGDKEGLGVIYNGDGSLILGEEEKILAREKGIIPTLKTSWRVYGGETLISTIKGDIYLTTDRLVFIGEREDVYLIGSEGARAAQEPGGLGLRSLATSGIRDFFEIPNLEIMGVERKSGVILSGELIYIYLLSQGKQYHLQMTLRSSSPLLKRLLNKEVPSLDDLVKNLKKYFQITDWMYTESEKAAWRDIIERKRAEADKIGVEQGIIPGREVEVDSRPIRPTREEAKKIDGLTVEYFRKLLEKGLITPKIYEKLTGEKAPEIKKEEIPEAEEAPSPPPTERQPPGIREVETGVAEMGVTPIKEAVEVPPQAPFREAFEKPLPPPSPPEEEKMAAPMLETSVEGPTAVAPALEGRGEGAGEGARREEGVPEEAPTPPPREELEKMLLETLQLAAEGKAELPLPPPPPEIESPQPKAEEADATKAPHTIPLQAPAPLSEQPSVGEGEALTIEKAPQVAGPPKVPGKKVKAKKIILKVKKPRKE